MTLKNLPLGIQNFEKICKENFIYVDKTKQIFELLKPPTAYYFLSRPRRFGKSLLISTLAYLFEGRKDLFEGLWIHENTDWKWEKHPVIIIDFNRIKNSTPGVLEKSITNMLLDLVQEHELEVAKDDISRLFGNIIIALHKKYQQDVVILIDEYDKPIINHIGKGKDELAIADKNRDVLKQFFGVLKGQDVAGHLRLVFLTGVSKFSRVSVFSDLNNLEDLTNNSFYADLLGYTESELYHYFQNHINNLSNNLEINDNECKHKLKTWYNGYRFTKRDVKVYNPFSTLSVLKSLDFQNYWFETGTPTFLVNLIKEYNYPVPEIEQLELRDTAFTKYDIETLSLEALLFQTGYITIKEVGKRKYHLAYPNQEVKNSFLDYIYEKIVTTKTSTIKNKFIDLADYLEESRYDDFIDTVNIILSSITYQQISNQDEPYYHTVFYLMLCASGVEVQTEVLTSTGRIDIAIFFADKVFIIELKCNTSADEAIKQIKDKEYAKRYEKDGKKIIIMGINFNTGKRSIDEWKMEIL